MNIRERFSPEIARYLEEVLGVNIGEFSNGVRAADSLIVAAILAMEYGLSFTPLRDKRPYVKGWPLVASSQIPDLLAWRLASVMNGPACDFGVLTGIAGGVQVLDFDGENAAENMRKLEVEYGALVSWQAITGSGGIHLYFKADPDGPDLRTTSKVLGIPLDVRGWHGQSAVVGTKRSNGRRNEWAPDRAPGEVELAFMPKTLFDALPKYIERSASTVGTRKRRPSFYSRSSYNAENSSDSMLLGDGPGHGGFHSPINSLCIQYFLKRGTDAPAEPLIAWLRHNIEAAPKGPDRDVSRYLSDEYLNDAVESAREFVEMCNGW